MSALELTNKSFTNQDISNIFFVYGESDQPQYCCARLACAFSAFIDEDSYLYTKFNGLSDAQLLQEEYYQQVCRMIGAEPQLQVSALSFDQHITKATLPQFLNRVAEEALAVLQGDFANTFKVRVHQLRVTGIEIRDCSDNLVLTWGDIALSKPAATQLSPAASAAATTAAPASAPSGPWVCPRCSAKGMQGNFCTNCGTPRP